MQNFLKTKTIFLAIIIFLIAIIFYIALSLYSGQENLKQAFLQFSLWPNLFFILVLVIFGWFLRGVRWHYFLLFSGIKQVPFSESLQVFFASFAFTVTPGKAGELVKSLFLKNKYDIPIAKTAGILFMERLMDLIAVLILGTGAIFLGFSKWWILLIAFIVILLCLLFLIKIEKITFLNKVTPKILDLFKASRFLLNKRILPQTLIISIFAWSTEAIAFYLVLTGLGISASFITAVFIYAISTLAGALSMLPGGIVGTEATMIGLLAWQGISAPIAVPAVLIIRFCTLWLIPILGVIFMIFLLKKQSKKGKVINN